MVLTGSPYFNEAGYDKQIGTSNGQLNSKNYNELVIVRLCDHIVASIRYVTIRSTTVLRTHSNLFETIRMRKPSKTQWFRNIVNEAILIEPVVM